MPAFRDTDFGLQTAFTGVKKTFLGRRGIADRTNKLTSYIGKIVNLRSKSKRIMGEGYNVIGRKGIKGSDRIVITAHIDAKKGSAFCIQWTKRMDAVNTKKQRDLIIQ